MKKPPKGSKPSLWAKYVKWVKQRLTDWDPADDHGEPGAYVPRYNGVRAEGVENGE